MTPSPLQSNQLANASSPYLQQHADNPVNWQLWTEDTLQLAKQADKPILLSIGYAACHWCHVMAHESFEDENTARLMNRLFVNIKVDREERPDVDQVYMAALHALGEQGGWPLTMFLTSDGAPYWGGTYFPPAPAHGLPAFSQVLTALENAYREKPGDIEKNSGGLKKHLEALSASAGQDDELDPSLLTEFQKRSLKLYDPVHGGIRGAPKFPNAPILETWARAANGNPESPYAKAFTHTIRKISLGGIYDHLNGGIARYSVDECWLVPHFEKMLYDNAHYLRHLVLAWKFTGDKLFRIRIKETVSWLAGEMFLTGQAFASSLDADSEGIEGKFYIWSLEELRKLLSAHELDEFAKAYDISPGGNWEGTNIPNLLSGQEIDIINNIELAEIRKKLLEHRNRRIAPARDDKILADWNGYLIRALCDVVAVTGCTKTLKLAENAFHFIAESVSESGKLVHSYRNNVKVQPCLATDYAAMINAALSLHETTGNQKYLSKVQNWIAALDEEFADGEGSYFLASSSSKDLLVRPRCDQDEANPSAASQILEAFVRYANLAADTEILAKAESLAKNQQSISKNSPYGMAGFMNALHSWFGHRHILITGTDETARNCLQKTASRLADPAVTVTVEANRKSNSHFGMTLPSTNDDAYAVVCSAQVCSAPIKTPEELYSYLMNP